MNNAATIRKTGSMIKHAFLPVILCGIALSSCVEVVTSGNRRPVEIPQLATDLDGRCWGNDTTPAVIETVTEQIIVQQASISSDGELLSPAIYRTVTHQKILRERREVQFETPCPAQWTPEFTATLQRALQARGFFRGTITGVIDGRTQRAIQAFQRQDGVDSPILAMATARQLGLIAFSREDLAEG